MDTLLEVAQLRQELSLLEHMLQLEKERRVQAERQAEAGKQACMQLQVLLAREQRWRKSAQHHHHHHYHRRREEEEGGGCTSAQDVPSSRPSPAASQNASGSEGYSGLSHLDELTSAIYGDLHSDLREILDVWAPG